MNVIEVGVVVFENLVGEVESSDVPKIDNVVSGTMTARFGHGLFLIDVLTSGYREIWV
jgi:hypothetical protein